MSTKTTDFGVSRREGHDSSDFYNRRIVTDAQKVTNNDFIPNSGDPQDYEWVNRFYCSDSRNLGQLTDRSIALAFTSPPYAVGKEYDQDWSLGEYRDLIIAVGEQVYRKLITGGRYVVNVVGLGRTPYIPMQALFWQWHTELGFLPMGDIIWRKGKGANGCCTWGSWMSAKAPRLRDTHEYLQVYCKEAYTRPDKGESTISREEFMSATLSIWEIPPESARRVGHPAPFPIALAERVIQLYSYKGDIVLDPFMGSGTTCLAAQKLGRFWVGVDISKDYFYLAERRMDNLYG